MSMFFFSVVPRGRDEKLFYAFGDVFYSIGNWKICCQLNLDEFVKTLKMQLFVIPANPGSGSGAGAGIQ
jgi:hypothetical protein